MRIITRNINAYETKGTQFPSRHTANAFRGAEMIHQELKESNLLLSYSGYLVAITVGVLRIYDKEHPLSEVLAGAGLGILSTHLLDSQPLIEAGTVDGIGLNLNRGLELIKLISMITVGTVDWSGLNGLAGL